MDPEGSNRCVSSIRIKSFIYLSLKTYYSSSSIPQRPLVRCVLFYVISLCVVYVRHKLTELAHSFFLKFYSCVHFCFYGSFNCISLHKFSRQLSVFWLRSSSFISALLVLSTTYLFLKVSFSPDIFLSLLLLLLTGLKLPVNQLNQLTVVDLT